MTRWHDIFSGAFTRRSGADYRTLGVSEYASDAEIEQAYLRLIAQYGPDRRVGLAAPLRRQVEKKAGQIEAAYERIKTLRRRSMAPLEPSRVAGVASEDRDTSRYLLWVALALIVLLAVTWLVPMRDQWMPPPQTQMPAPATDASPRQMPASPAVVAPPAPSPAPPAAKPVERLVTLMPKDPPPARTAASATPQPPALTGEAALVEALRAGQLRPATGGDLARWAARWSQANSRGVPAVFQERSGHMKSYVIQKDFTIPDGLYGAHSVIFLLDTRVPYPRGNPGHSAILDLSTGSCMGSICGILLD